LKISEKDVLYVAELANLELTPEEREGMVRDLSSILGYVDHLN
jgi:aspartyl-tRNA(Asn)/glutamyl-tRNA(Gln) amidotransferase subunit C